ncbi:amino acid ABC transporter permease [Halobacillus yeomjeoni]|uniref:Amino acid ABC transporter permease n=1 Tax=Halobacillus yeomjeoni TaxID=311194 RepID=A0A931HWQ6_9BACI|nr:amino acid ABC transporter permease [Halobacillus yeomjeoni]MBH0230843.1 amino acid ABC transporter permease [Halobacillus yeomjeoni]MCA0984718.1 amino acid ABC transporter permease [Halobacillus yeomjeoni]
MEAFLESHYVRVMPFLLEGLVYTLLITGVGLFFGFILGAIVGLARLSKNKIIYVLSSIYVEALRGTPILAQILFIYFGLPDLLGFNIDKITASIIAIAVNAGAYIAEIVRGAVYSIDKGQNEAGRSIGLTRGQTMRYIIWPQAFRRMIPPLGNQFVISLKDTSLFSVIAVGEMLYMGQQYYGITFAAFEALTMVCLMYLAITVPTALYLRKVERRLDV